MKKNISNLIAEISRKSKTNKVGRFKITCKNANAYMNKILVDSEEFNKPSLMERFVDS